MPNYYAIKNMLVPTRELYGLSGDEKVLLVGTAKRQEWAVSIDIDLSAPCDILATGLALPFSSLSFDVVILDYVTNFLPKEYMVEKMIAEANRVGKKVVGRATVTPGKKITLSGSKQRFSHPAYPPGVQWLRDTNQ